MSTVADLPFKRKQDDDSRAVEELLRRRFPRTEAYRSNSASIRIRVIDPEFEGLSRQQRADLVEPYLDQLDERLHCDIVFLLMIAPLELQQSTATFREFLRNSEFEDPSPSML